MKRIAGIGALFVLTFVMRMPILAQWLQTDVIHGADVFGFALSGTTLFAGAAGPSGGVFLSTDGGTSWIAASRGLTNTYVKNIALSGTDLFAGTFGGVFISTDKGTSWDTASSGLTNLTVEALAVSGMYLFAGTYGGGVFRSTDKGTSWSPASSGLMNPYVISLAVSSPDVFAGTSDGVFRSTDNGASWTAANIGMRNSFVRALAFSGKNLFAGTSDGTFLSIDSGRGWTAVNTGLEYGIVFSFAVSDSSLFSGTNGGVYLSTNSGASWIAVNDGLADHIPAAVFALAVSGTNLIAGTNGRGVWRRSLSEMVTSGERLSSALPTRFILAQNFPNPFNPSTTIRYGLPSRSHVTLTVFNTHGQQVSMLVQGEQDAGYHEVRFDGANFPSGVYFYRIQAGSILETKRLLLLR